MGRKFYRALRDLAAKLGCHPHDLLAVIYLESACKPAAFNKTTSAVGLIQFLPATLKAVGYHQGPYEFQKLSAWEQMPYIEKYFAGVVKAYGPLTDVTRLYRAVLYPLSLSYGDTDGVAIFVSSEQAYQYNKGLDLDADGVVSVHDIKRKFDIITAQTDFDKFLTEMMFESPVSAPDVIAEVALRYVDIGSQLDIDRYLEVMAGPGDDDSTRRYLLSGPSTCALFARGVWRIAGVESGILTAKYRIGHAVSDVVEIAKAHNAWRPYPTQFLQKGDVILVTAPEHIAVCVSDPREMSPTSFEIDTVEGGQAPNSSYVRRFSRGLEIRDGKMYTRGTSPRVVVGRADACALLPAEPQTPALSVHVMNHPVLQLDPSRDPDEQ